LLLFKFHQIELHGRWFVLLPKLTHSQLETLAERLRGLGFKTAGQDPLRATKDRTRIVLERRGLCSSNRDLLDVLAPAIPSILETGTEAVSLRELCGAYFRIKTEGGSTVLSLLPRLESSSTWDALRVSGSCGLTPDEKAVYSFLVSRPGIRSRILTNYPSDECSVRMIGRKQYYSCSVEGPEASFNLCEVGVAKSRSAYLPRDSIIRFSPFVLGEGSLRSVLAGLGEWCFLTAKPPAKL
jgi:hypothetical protein